MAACWAVPILRAILASRLSYDVARAILVKFFLENSLIFSARKFRLKPAPLLGNSVLPLRNVPDISLPSDSVIVRTIPSSLQIGCKTVS